MLIRYDYVRTQWAIWRAGGVAVPLCTSHPSTELEYPSIQFFLYIYSDSVSSVSFTYYRHVIKDSQSSVIVSTPEYQDLIKPLADKLKLRYLLLPSPATSSTLFKSPGTSILFIYVLIFLFIYCSFSKVIIQIYKSRGGR